MKQRILLTGKDGIDLLQRITTLDFNRLEVGKLQPGLILNPQGKIISYFEALKTHIADQIEFNCDSRFLELLDQYTFGERYQIQNLEHSQNEHHPDSESNRIQNLIPKMGHEFLTDGETNPMEVNLIHAIHDQKGCYPGQEIIEKIIAIGSPAKRLCLVKQIEGELKPIELPLELDQGKLTSFEFPFGLAVVRKTHCRPGAIISSQGIRFTVEKSS